MRLDSTEAVDSVCDQKGDKGVDGIYVNDDALTIEVYQSKISQKATSTIGDTLLKEFSGTLNQFRDAVTLADLVKSAGNADVARLVTRLDLIKRIPNYEVKGIFVCNSDLDSNGQAYIKTDSRIKFVGQKN